MRLKNTLIKIRDSIHAQLCYQLFITPLHLPIEKRYRHFFKRAHFYFIKIRSAIIERDSPRHHVLHHFAPREQSGTAKKVLITHGWTSRATYMAHLIHSLHQHGFEIYALDFPAHGEAKGMQLPWTDAVLVLKNILNEFGPFYAVIGHSFGGSMLLNTLILAKQIPEWQLYHEPQRVVLLASPTRMRTPVSRFARRLKLSGQGLRLLREVFRRRAFMALNKLDFRRYTNQSNTPFLCIHGDKDNTVKSIESSTFCQHYPYASLSLLSGANHVSVLMDKRVEKLICQFLEDISCES